MHMHDIHSCAQFCAENEKLKKTLRRVKRENEEMKRKINALEEQRKMETMLKQFVTTRNMESQTEPVRMYGFASHAQQTSRKVQNTDSNPDSEKLNKMLVMHNNLLKRYEKELKANMNHVETITQYNLQVNELQQKLKELEIQANLRRHADTAANRLKKSPAADEAGGRHDDDDGGSPPLMYQYHCVRKERDKLKKENEKLRQEIKGLDHGFFDEVEDLKFALHQSSLLNKEYEKSLRRLCKRFGVPYPEPERKFRQVLQTKS